MQGVHKLQCRYAGLLEQGAKSDTKSAKSASADQKYYGRDIEKGGAIDLGDLNSDLDYD